MPATAPRTYISRFTPPEAVQSTRTRIWLQSIRHPKAIMGTAPSSNRWRVGHDDRCGLLLDRSTGTPRRTVIACTTGRSAVPDFIGALAMAVE